jgi:dynein heavy chain
MFGSWLHMGLAEEERYYEHITGLNIPRLPSLMEEYQDEYNHGNATPIHLVFFHEAIEHISRLNRILCQPRGHAMIVGMGGNGKETLARFASFMQDMIYFQVNPCRGCSLLDNNTRRCADSILW